MSNAPFPAPSPLRRVRRTAWRRLAPLVLALLAPVPLAAQLPMQDIAVVFHGNGVLYAVANGQWVERDLDGKLRSRYVETARSQDAIQLEDPVTQTARELNLRYRYVFYLEPGKEKTPVHKITLTKSAADSEYYRAQAQLGDASKCLEAVRTTQMLSPPGGSRPIPVQRFDPLFVDCNESISQRWSITRATAATGESAYLWRNQRAEIAGLDICLTGRGENGILAMTRCADAPAQRWIHSAPDTTPIARMHSADAPDTWCLVLNPPRADLPGLQPKHSAACDDPAGTVAPSLRLQRIVD